VAVQHEVQNTVEQVTDQEHWGVSEKWDYPSDGRGDCEDFVLLKRKMLERSGLSESALLITVVRLPDGSGHATLLVRTDHGDFVLDNLSNKVSSWAERGYSYVKRQSAENPNQWVMLKRVRHAPVMVAGKQ
jgi:predicted transglutaminase-like cysteine proteinase